MDIEVKEFKPKSGTRKHAITLAVYTDNREAMSTIPNPRSYADEGGPGWVMSFGDPVAHRHEIASLIGSYEYLLSPDLFIHPRVQVSTYEDVLEQRLGKLQAAVREDEAAMPVGFFSLMSANGLAATRRGLMKRG